MTAHTPAERSAVLSAHYVRLLARGDTVRARAQGAYATVGALAGGVVGVGLLTNLAQLSTPVRLLGLGATGAWTAAVAGFVLTASTSVATDPDGPPAAPPSDDALIVADILARAEREERHVRSRLKAALTLATVAAVTTATTVALAVREYPSNSERAVSMVLTPSSVDLLVGQCAGAAGPAVVVDVRGLASSSSFLDIVVVQGPATGCHLLVPRTAILGFRLP